MTTSMECRLVNFRADDDLRRDIRDCSQREHINSSEFIRRAIRTAVSASVRDRLLNEDLHNVR